MRAIVLAAGRGTRLWPLTGEIPKPLLPVGHAPLIVRIFDQLARMGCSELMVNTLHEAELLKTAIGPSHQGRIPVQWFLEDRLTGPAGGARRFLERLEPGEDVLVVSGDAYHQFDLEALLRFHREKGAWLTVVMKRVPDPERYGIAICEPDGRVVAFREKGQPSEQATNLVSCGVYCIRKECLALVPADSEYDFGRHLIPRLAQDRAPVYGFQTEAPWRDIGDAREYWMANLEAVEQAVPAASGGARLLVAPTAKVDAGAELAGTCVIGAGAVVEAGARLSRCVILPGARVPAGMVLAEAVVGQVGGIRAWALHRGWESAHP